MYVSPNHPDYARLTGTQDAEPESAGRNLAAIPRGPAAELRITLDEYEGHPYVQLRAWERGAGGWFPTKKGVTVRLRELEAVAEALRGALEVAGVPDAKGERRPVNPLHLPPVPSASGKPPWNGEGDDIPY